MSKLGSTQAGQVLMNITLSKDIRSKDKCHLQILLAFWKIIEEVRHEFL